MTAVKSYVHNRHNRTLLNGFPGAESTLDSHIICYTLPVLSVTYLTNLVALSLLQMSRHLTQSPLTSPPSLASCPSRTLFTACSQLLQSLDSKQRMRRVWNFCGSLHPKLHTYQLRRKKGMYTVHGSDCRNEDKYRAPRV